MLAGLLFTTVLLAVGFSTYHLVRSSLLDQLEVQLVEELTLFRGTHDKGGLALLIDAMRQFEEPAIAGQRLAGVFDENGAKLAGNIEVGPNALLSERQLAFIADAQGDMVIAHSAAIERKMIVVGRNPEVLENTLCALVRGLVIAGLAALVGSLLIGWILSRRSMQKLEHIAVTLEKVAQGDIEARVLTGAGNGQIDRVSRLIDASLERLSALMESTHNTSRAIAHDLRSPLNRAFILVREAAQTGQKQLLADAEEALYNLGAIFDTVLRISRLEASTDRSAFSIVDLHGLVQAVVDVFEPAFAARQQAVVFGAEAVPVPVFADEQMLKQLLTNLLQNFHRHTPVRSTVTLSISQLENSGAILQVADDGPGIPIESRDDMMKPFQRLDDSRSEEGSGLGLALAKAIAIRHGATIRLMDNNPGLCVELQFPPLPLNLSNS